MSGKLMLVLMHPRERVLDLLCANTCALAPHIQFVENARIEDRQITAEGLIVSVQRWRARAHVPQLLRTHLDDDLLEWIVQIHTNGARFSSRWQLASVSGRDRCVGTLVLLPAMCGRATRIEVAFEIFAANIGLRTIFEALVNRVWREFAQAAGKVLDQQPGSLGSSVPISPALQPEPKRRPRARRLLSAPHE